MKKYSVDKILHRASQLGIVLYVEGDNIKVEGPAEHLTDKLREVLAEHKRELLAVLPSPLCASCLDAGRETRATREGPDGMMLCDGHQPEQAVLPLPPMLSKAKVR